MTGRPPEYNPKYPQMTKDYVASCVDEEIRRIVSDGEKTTTYQYRVKVNLPTIEGLSLFLGVHKDTIYEWEKQGVDPLFSDALVYLRAEQGKRLVNSGLSGDYVSPIAKVLLVSHGYKDATVNAHTDGEGKPLNMAPQISMIDFDSYLQSKHATRSKDVVEGLQWSSTIGTDSEESPTK
jgi:hypothetical protein